MRHHRHGPAFLTSLLLLIALAIYLPGLHGGFLFDDFANLPALGATGPVDTWATFWRYITSGKADPLGRPLALLTFLLDARDWPANPLPFKRTNLILHLVNGALLMWLLRSLGQKLPHSHPANSELSRHQTIETAHRINLAASLAAGLWVLHPLFVSTTLYIVQREAMLPAMFTLLGLLSWLHSREKLMRGRALQGTAWMVFGLGGCTMLGTLCKANGALLPALALTIEYTLLNSPVAPSPDESFRGKPKIYRKVMLLMAWLPTLFIATYLLHEGWSGLVHGVSSVRPWTMAQRLLTEPRVLMDYLGLLWIPRPFTPGLFNDHIQISTSLLSPFATLPALLSVVALIVVGYSMRRRWPALAATILFYFVGQVLESSTVALELFYEHRNYLPAMLMFWPLALWLCGACPAAQGTPISAWRNAKLVLAAILLTGFALTTWARASLWGNTTDQALLWAQLNPYSPRAQANAAQAEMSKGLPGRAVMRLQTALTTAPDEVQLALNLFSAQCQLGHVTDDTVVAVDKALRTTRDPGSFLVRWFEPAIAQARQPTCPQSNLQTYETLLDAAAENPRLSTRSGRRQDLAHLRGVIELDQNNASLALTNFNLALDQQPTPAIALRQAALLGSVGFTKEALAHLDHYASMSGHQPKPGLGMPRIHSWVLDRQHYWQKELARLRATLLDDDAHRTGAE